MYYVKLRNYINRLNQKFTHNKNYVKNLPWIFSEISRGNDHFRIFKNVFCPVIQTKKKRQYENLKKLRS